MLAKEQGGSRKHRIGRPEPNVPRAIMHRFRCNGSGAIHAKTAYSLG